MAGRPLDLNALRTLVAVVEEGSMSAAARRLAYSQSAVSMQLRRLETNLGVALLVRAQGGIRPTRLGEIVIGHARDMLATDRSLRDAISEQTVGGVLRFGLPADLAPSMRGIWARFAALHPRVEMQVRSELSASLCRRLDDGDLDLAMLTLPIGSTRGTLLRREPLVWVAGRGSQAPRQSRLALAVGPDGACAFRSAALAALESAGRDWRIAYEGQSFAPLAAPVAVGLALTVAIPSMLTLAPDVQALDAAAAGLPILPSVELRLADGMVPATTAAGRLAALIRDEVN